MRRRRLLLAIRLAWAALRGRTVEVVMSDALGTTHVIGIITVEP